MAGGSTNTSNVSGPHWISEGFKSPSGGSGTFYAHGFYFSPSTSVALTQASTTQTYGSANVGYGAHAFIVAGSAGTTDGSDLVLKISGTSITDGGVRTTRRSFVRSASCAAPRSAGLSTDGHARALAA